MMAPMFRNVANICIKGSFLVNLQCNDLETSSVSTVVAQDSHFSTTTEWLHSHQVLKVKTTETIT